MKQQVYRIDAGDPNGYVMAESPAICFSKQGGIWIKTNDTKDANGWLSIIENGQLAAQPSQE